MKKDLKVFKEMYSQRKHRQGIYIYPDNWKKTPEKWQERFK